MQTVTVSIKEDKLDQFLKIVDGLKEDIVEDCIVSTNQDSDYLSSTQFQQDKKMFNSRLDDIHNGKAILFSKDQYSEKMDGFIANLEQKHADC